MFGSIILKQMRTLSALSVVLAATHPETKSRTVTSSHQTRTCYSPFWLHVNRFWHGSALMCKTCRKWGGGGCAQLNLSTTSTCFKSVTPVSGNLWEPGLRSLILYLSTPPSSVSHFQFHLLPPLCDFHLILTLKFTIYSRFFSWFHAVAVKLYVCTRFFGIANQGVCDLGKC